MNRDTRVFLRLVQIVLTCSMALWLSAWVFARTAAAPPEASRSPPGRTTASPFTGKAGNSLLLRTFGWAGLTRISLNLVPTLARPKSISPGMIWSPNSSARLLEPWAALRSGTANGAFFLKISLCMWECVSGTGIHTYRQPRSRWLGLKLSGRAKVIMPGRYGCGRTVFWPPFPGTPAAAPRPLLRTPGRPTLRLV